MKIISLSMIILFLFSGAAPAQRWGRQSERQPERQSDRQPEREETCRAERGLIILVQFPDIQHSVRREYAQKRFFRELNDYVKEMSYGSVCIRGDVTEKWITLPDPVSKYRISSRNLEVDKSRIRKIIDDALQGVEKDVDFSQYSFVAIFLGAKLREYGMIGLCGYPGMLGWSADDALKTPGGQVVRGGVAIYSYQAHLGTLFHDIAHILGGVKDGTRRVPCLYDHDLQAKPGDIRETFLDSMINMGFWDTMSCHYTERDMPPPGISSWTKLRLGWLDPKRVRTVDLKNRSVVVLDPLEDSDGKVLAIRIPLSETTYYLIENRQPIGFDKSLPGSGILIMYGDDRIKECRHGKAPVKLVDADPSQDHLKGAAFDQKIHPEYTDRENNLRVRIAGKEGTSYKIEIGPY